MRNAKVSPPALRRPSLAGGFLRATVRVDPPRRARVARTARSGVPTKRAQSFKMGVGGKLGNLADPRLGLMPLDHAPHRHSRIGAGRQCRHTGRPSAHRHFSVDFRLEIRSNAGDSLSSVWTGRHAAASGATVLWRRLAGRPSTMIEEGEGIADRGAYTSSLSALLSNSTRKKSRRRRRTRKW